MKTVQARLDEKLPEELKVLQLSLDLSQFEVVHESLRPMMKHHASLKPRKILGQGKFASVFTDLATNRKYMEDFGLSSMGRRSQ